MIPEDPQRQAYYAADGEWVFDVHYIGGKSGWTFSPEKVSQILSQVGAFITEQQRKVCDNGEEPLTSCVIRVALTRSPTGDERQTE